MKKYKEVNIDINKIFKVLIIYYISLIYICNFFEMGRIGSLLYKIPSVGLIGLAIVLRKKIKLNIYNKVLLLYAISIIAISFIRGDIENILNVLQFVLPIFFFVTFNIKIENKFINRLLIGCIVIGFVQYYLADNIFGVFPFQGKGEIHNRLWRVSIFGTGGIALTGALAQLALIVNIYKKNIVFCLISIYLIIFTASKTGIVVCLFIGIVLVINRFIKNNKFKKNMLNFSAYIVIFINVIAVILINAWNMNIQNGAIKDFLNIGEVGQKTLGDARLILWNQHLNLFKNNILGVGDFNLQEYYTNIVAETESFFTYILARDGIIAIILIIFFAIILYKFSEKNNILGIMTIGAIIISMFFYGSYATGYNGIFLLYFGVISTEIFKNDKLENKNIKTDNIFVCTTEYQIYMASLVANKINKKAKLFILNASKLSKITPNLIGQYKWEKIEYLNYEYGNLNEMNEMISYLKENYSSKKYKIYIGTLTNNYIEIISEMLGQKVSIFDDGLEAVNYLNGYKYKYDFQYIKSFIKREILGIYIAFNHDIYIKSSKKRFKVLTKIYTMINEFNDNRVMQIKDLQKCDKYTNECYFLGQPLIEIGYLNEDTYLKIIEKIQEYYNSKGLEFKYIKHPREKKKNINMIENKDILEIEVQKKDGIPINVSGFFSTALINMKLLFPEIEVEAWKINGLSNEVEEIYKLIENNKIKVLEYSKIEE